MEYSGADRGHDPSKISIDSLLRPHTEAKPERASPEAAISSPARTLNFLLVSLSIASVVHSCRKTAGRHLAVQKCLYKDISR